MKEGLSRGQVLALAEESLPPPYIAGCFHICQTLVNLGWAIRKREGLEPLTWTELKNGCEYLKIELLPIEAKWILHLSAQFVNSVEHYRDNAEALDPHAEFWAKHNEKIKGEL